jgi:hypothetical protein
MLSMPWNRLRSRRAVVAMSVVVPAALCAAFLPVHSAQAGLIIDLGGGWEAEIMAAPTAFADVSTDFVDEENDRIFVQKFWEFTDGDGLPDPANIMFRQIAPDDETVSRIYINQETIVNHTGMDWTSFHLMLVGTGVQFNPALSADFSIAPFTDLAFSNGNRNADITGGVLPDGDTPWTPGLDEGALVIEVNLSGSLPAKFLLTEVAGVIPAPGALALMCLAGLASTRRRRA